MDSFEKFIVPAEVPLISWLIKDYLFGLNVKRNDALRHEWEYRLKEIWSPLYYWSGVILFGNDSKGWAKHGVGDLEKTLAKSAHLIPRQHFYVLIKLIEMATGQQTRKTDLDEIQKTREYVYSQIELLNYLLYRKSGIDDVSVKTNILHPYRHLLRLMSLAVTHLAIWVAIAAIILIVYSLYSDGYYSPVGILAVGLIVLVIVDFRKRREIEKEIGRRLKQ